MTLPLFFYVIAATAVVLTGLSKSGFGGGLGVMAVPLMSLFVDPQLAAAILMPILISMDAIIVWQYRQTWERQIVLTLLPGALLGLLIGAVSFQWMNANLVRMIIGVLALLLVAQYLLGQGGKPRKGLCGHRVTTFLLGALSGFTSYIAHAGGPPVKGYLLRQALEKSVFVGTNTMYFLALNAFKTISYSFMGQLSAATLKISLVLSPMLLVGILLGTLLHKRIDQSRFTFIVYFFLLLTGLKLLFDGLASGLLQ